MSARLYQIPAVVVLLGLLELLGIQIQDVSTRQNLMYQPHQEEFQVAHHQEQSVRHVMETTIAYSAFVTISHALNRTSYANLPVRVQFVLGMAIVHISILPILLLSPVEFQMLIVQPLVFVRQNSLVLIVHWTLSLH